MLKRWDSFAWFLTDGRICLSNNAAERTWLADVLARIADHSVKSLHQLFPWEWKLERTAAIAAE